MAGDLVCAVRVNKDVQCVRPLVVSTDSSVRGHGARNVTVCADASAVDHRLRVVLSLKGQAPLQTRFRDTWRQPRAGR